MVLGDILRVPGRVLGNAGQELREWSWQGSEAQDVPLSVPSALRRGIFRAGILGQGLSEARGVSPHPQGCPELPAIRPCRPEVRSWRWMAARQDGPSVHLSIPPGSAPSICPSLRAPLRPSVRSRGICAALAAAAAGRVWLGGCRAQPRSRQHRGASGCHPGAVPGGSEPLRSPHPLPERGITSAPSSSPSSSAHRPARCSARRCGPSAVMS